jgi:hypothetical protein
MIKRNGTRLVCAGQMHCSDFSCETDYVARSSCFASGTSVRSHDSGDINASAVCIETGYGLNDKGVGVRLPVGERILIYPCRPDRFLGLA